MSWFIERTVVPYHPVTCDLPGNVRLIIGCDGRWIYTSKNESWENFFIFQQNNFSGVEWDEETILRKSGKLSTYRIFKVPSSKGDKNYTIVVNGNYISCNCTGFSFRKRCRHTQEIREKLIEECVL